VRGRVGAERELVLAFRAVAQCIQHEARLDTRGPRRRIDREDAVHVFREVNHDRDVAALSGQAGAGAARQDRRAEAAARRHGGDHVVGIAGHHQPDRYLAVIGGVGGVEGAAAGVEADFAAHGAPQLGFERPGLGEGVDRFTVRAQWQRYEGRGHSIN
jgi:hypothetical protein